MDFSVPGERFELPTNGLQNRCSTTELTRLAAESGPLSTTAGLSEYRFAKVAPFSQTDATRRAARIALRGPSGTAAAPRLQGRRVQTPFLARSSAPHPEAGGRAHPQRTGFRRVYR